MGNSPETTDSSKEITENDKVTGSVIYRRVDPEKKKALKKLIKETAKKHGLVAHIFERK
ncbi:MULTISPECIES: hypothetical protein [unclassified Pseudoalteromonas]|uniref:hypothetical protein n=1 Tax=unclassified Pseudoalteromonas TaxID=194690 RepID=UPI0015FF1304|nr:MULTISPECIES: hypothetical protein [unclassified Pseudoalteromonas]MBB1410209.1 hypothetical protein [Pseudoalteromonas sp. SG44-17]MBB1469316.1 hypothetical protein [Pseudoalteromonas sp. SG41-5]